MKELTLIMIAAIATMTNSIAQETTTTTTSTNYREQFMFGFKIGTNFSNVYDSEGEDFDADGKFGLAAGGFLSIPITKFIGIQPEVLFSQKGFSATGTILGGSYDFKRTTNYLDVPLFVTIKPVEFITIMAGPQYSYLFNQKDEFKNASTSIAQEQEFENDDIRKNTFCFAGGLELNMQHFVLGTRAGWDVMNNHSDGSSTTPRYKNVWMQATLGYRF